MTRERKSAKQLPVASPNNRPALLHRELVYLVTAKKLDRTIKRTSLIFIEKVRLNLISDWLICLILQTYLNHPSVETKLCFFFNVPSKTQLGIVLWSHLCVVVASQSLYLDKKWRKKGSFSMNLLSKISTKAKNDMGSFRELNPSLPHGRPVT